MTSDRGNTGAAEMHLPNTPVTPKTTGLNPNATEFHSKGPTTPPDSATDGWMQLEFEGTTPQTTANVEGVTYINGDAERLPKNVTFPPTPESPSTTSSTPVTGPAVDYPVVNGSSSGGTDTGAESPVEGVVAGGEVVGAMEAQALFPTPPQPAPPVQVEEPLVTNTSVSSAVSEDSVVLEQNYPDDQLRAMLKHQLEYYFSRENLAQDTYLVSQMDPDQYVPILTIAKFNQVKKLTGDLELVVNVLRESTNVQVDDAGEKVRPLHQRCVVILREVPSTTPVADVENLFSGVNCPRFASCEFASGNCWYVTFDSEADAQRAYQYLREEVRNFLGKPIMARIKAKPILRSSSFIPKNGLKAGSTTSPAIGTSQPQAPTTAPPPPTVVTAPTTAQFTPQPEVFSPQPAPQPPAPQVPKMNFTPQQLPAVPVSVPFIPAVQTTPVSQNLPFFPPTNSMTIWQQTAPAPQMAFFDPGTAFHANGYTPTGTFKLPNAGSKPPQHGPHGYQNVRASQQPYRNPKPNRYQQQQQQPQQTSVQQTPPQAAVSRTQPSLHQSNIAPTMHIAATPQHAQVSIGTDTASMSSVTTNTAINNHSSRVVNAVPTGHSHNQTIYSSSHPHQTPPEVVNHSNNVTGSGAPTHVTFSAQYSNIEGNGGNGAMRHNQGHMGPHGGGHHHNNHYNHYHQSHQNMSSDHHSHHPGSGNCDPGHSRHSHTEASIKDIPPRLYRNREQRGERDDRRDDRRDGRPVDERRDREYYRNRRRNRLSDEEGAKRNPMSAKERVPESFDLEASSFPPLPGSQNNNSSNGVFESGKENKMSDIVRGTASKPVGLPSPKDPKPSSSAPVNFAKDDLSINTKSSGIATEHQQQHKRKSASPQLMLPSNPPPVVVVSAVTTATTAAVVSSPVVTSSTTSQQAPASLPTPPLSPKKVSKATSADATLAKSANSSKPAVAIETKQPASSTSSSSRSVVSSNSISHSNSAQTSSKVEKEKTPDRLPGATPADKLPGATPTTGSGSSSATEKTPSAQKSAGRQPAAVPTAAPQPPPKLSYASIVSSKTNQNTAPTVNGEATNPESNKAETTTSSSSTTNVKDQPSSTSSSSNSHVTVSTGGGNINAPTSNNRDNHGDGNAGNNKLRSSPTRYNNNNSDNINNQRNNRGGEDNYNRRDYDNRRGSDRDTDGYRSYDRRDRYDGPKDQRPFRGRRGGYRGSGDRDSYSYGNRDNYSGGRNNDDRYGNNRNDRDYGGNRGSGDGGYSNRGDGYSSRGGYRGRNDRDNYTRDRRPERTVRE